MRVLSVIHILGFLLMFLAAAMLLPIPFSLYYGDDDVHALWISALTTAVFGFVGWISTRARFNRDLRPKEGFFVVAMGWTAFSVFGSLPFLLSGAIPSFTDAFFETMSGFSTTGATILPHIEGLPHGVLFWRSLTHWIGGMGIVVLSLAILPFLGVGGMQLYKAELRSAADRLTPRITETMKILSGVYVSITLVEAGLLMIGKMSLFDALCHSFGTMATGGYSTRDGSIGAFMSTWIDYVVIFFMVAAGTNFSLHYRFLKGDFKAYFRNVEFMFFLSLIGIATALIMVDTVPRYGDNLPRAFRDTLFQVVSILTTTGYGTADYEQWSQSSIFILFLLMFFGGCAGSTGGGMKMLRVHVLVKFVYTELMRLIHPRAVVPVRIGKQALERDVVGNVVGYFILYIIVFTGGVLVMTGLGLDAATAFGSTVACLSNIGPGLGAVGPTDNYSQIPVVGKWFLSFLMLTGRLELYTVLILFAPGYWKK